MKIFGIFGPKTEKMGCGKITKMAKNPFFILKGGNFFWATLFIWGDNFFVFSILFDLIKKNGQNRKKGTFAHGPFFQFLAQKCQKCQFSWKNLFLTIFLWVISVRKGFLYFWQTPIFEPTRAILLRRVWYQPFRLKFWVPYPPQQNGSSGFKYRFLSKV